MPRRAWSALAVLLLAAVLVVAGWWYQARHTAAQIAASTLTVNVTSGADRGPGTLREALFVAATAHAPARIVFEVREVSIETALPPVVAAHGVTIVGHATVLDAHALPGGPVLDLAAPGASVEGVTVRGCSGSAVLLRARQFRLLSSSIEHCDVGVDVAANASDVLLEHDRFSADRIGVRFAAATPDTSVVGNRFEAASDAGIWAVRSETEMRTTPVLIRDNVFDRNHTGVVAGNVAVQIEHNEFLRSQDAAVHLVGAGASVRSNHVSGGSAMGIIAENASGAVIEGNELDGLPAYGIMVRGSANTLVRGNRIYNCGYGLAFVLGNAASPSTAVSNTVIEPRFNGIDVIGDSPILRRNQIVRPHALALNVQDYRPPDGRTVRGEPFLEGNSFGGAPTRVTADVHR